jgi:hypothetical protein
VRLKNIKAKRFGDPGEVVLDYALPTAIAVNYNIDMYATRKRMDEVTCA